MLIPRKVKHRKQHRPHRTGAATGGTRVTFGEFGIQALEPAYVTNRQIESARIAINRHIRRGGKVWIYKGDLSGNRAERAAQKAARSVAGGRGARPGRGDRPSRGDRPARNDRPERGGRRRAEGVTEGAPAVEASAPIETAITGQEG